MNSVIDKNILFSSGESKIPDSMKKTKKKKKKQEWKSYKNRRVGKIVRMKLQNTNRLIEPLLPL